MCPLGNVNMTGVITEAALSLLLLAVLREVSKAL